MASKPTMTVVAGPAGSGKSVRFKNPSIDAFNVDDRCRELHGSYHGIPPAIRRQAQAECEQFVKDHIRTGTSFATETTLRTRVAIDQAMAAQKAGFYTVMVYVATDDVELNVERIRLRSLAGGHSASPDTIQDNYRRSLGNLPAALPAFDRIDVYDNSGIAPRHILRVKAGHVRAVLPPLPQWLRAASAGSSLAGELDPPG